MTTTINTKLHTIYRRNITTTPNVPTSQERDQNHQERTTQRQKHQNTTLCSYRKISRQLRSGRIKATEERLPPSLSSKIYHRLQKLTILRLWRCWETTNSKHGLKAGHLRDHLHKVKLVMCFDGLHGTAMRLHLSQARRLFRRVFIGWCGRSWRSFGLRELSVRRRWCRRWWLSPGRSAGCWSRRRTRNHIATSIVEERWRILRRDSARKWRLATSRSVVIGRRHRCL